MDRKRYIVVGLGFGDESKGATVDSLCRETHADLVVRFNGGAQAAHNVVTDDLHHTFAQWGSGTLFGAKTLLSKHMLVNPSRFVVEGEALMAKEVDIKGKAFVDDRAFVTTPYPVCLNRVREAARGAARHGTTGMGISETVIDTLACPGSAMRIWDITQGKKHIMDKLYEVRGRLQNELCNLGGNREFERLDAERIADCYLEFAKMATILKTYEVREMINATKTIVFEGAQGVLLDENFGFHPHTTWSTTTPKNAIDILLECSEANYVSFDEIKIIGVTRSYTTRHGAGPMPTENTSVCFPEAHNGDDGPAGQFRKGWLDLPLLKYAARCCGNLHGLVVSHMDCMPVYYCFANALLDGKSPPASMREQEGLTRLAWQPADPGEYDLVPGDFPRFIADELKIPLLGIGMGPSAPSRQWFVDDAFRL